MDSLHVLDEPNTERSGVDEGVTTMGSPAVAQLHHLRALTAALEPARAHYVATAVEQLRSLPANVRRQVFAQVLSEHPMLAAEPPIQELAAELGIAEGALTGTATTAAYARMEGLLPVVALGLAALENARTELVTELGIETTSRARLPRTANDVLAWFLDEDVSAAVRAEELGRCLRALVLHTRALREAAQESARALVLATDPDALAARTRTPAWWPKPFRDSAVLAGVRALHRLETGGRRYLDEVHGARFAQVYVATANERP